MRVCPMIHPAIVVDVDARMQREKEYEGSPRQFIYFAVVLLLAGLFVFACFVPEECSPKASPSNSCIHRWDSRTSCHGGRNRREGRKLQ